MKFALTRDFYIDIMLLLFVPAFVPFLPNPLFGEKMRNTIKLAIINVFKDQIGENSKMESINSF